MEEAVNAARAHVNNAIIVVKGMKNTVPKVNSLTARERFLHNKKFDKQLRVFSIKKKTSEEKKGADKTDFRGQRKCVGSVK